MSIARRAMLGSLVALSLSAFSIAANAQAKKEIVIGATAGPYADQVKFGIKPVLEKKGYSVRVVEFNDYIQPNFALAQGSLDANVFQHVVYLTKFATDNKLPLSELIKVPTAPMALFSKKHRSAADVPDGATIALPNDPTNAARALVTMEQLGWIKLKDGVDPLRASERDVAINARHLKLVPLEAAQLPRSLDDTAFSFINGNFAIASGLKLKDAVTLEKLTPTYYNIVAIRTADKDQPWVRDLTDAYRSRDFLVTIDTRFPGFAKPDYLQALETTVAK